MDIDPDNVPIIDETPESTLDGIDELPESETDVNNVISHSDTRQELGLLQQAMLTFQKNSQNKLNENAEAEGDEDGDQVWISSSMKLCVKNVVPNSS